MLLKKSNISLLMLWVVLMSVSPFIFEEIGILPNKIFVIIFIPIMGLLILFKRKISRIKSNVILIVLFQTFYFLIVAIVYQEQRYLFIVFQSLCVAVIILFVHAYIGYEKTIKSVLWVITGISILAVLGFFLALSGILEPIVLFQRGPNEMVYSYVITFTNQIWRLGNTQFIRPSGFFLEGGVLGFFIIHSLILNKLSVNNKRIEILLSVSGIITMSMAFYISLILYFSLYYVNRRYILKFLVIVIISATTVFAIVQLKNYNSTLNTFYWLTVDRFNFSEDLERILKGNNRLPIILEGIDHFKKSPVFGSGRTYTFINYPIGVASIMGPLISYGVVGTFMFFLHIIYFSTISFLQVFRRGSISVDDFGKASIILLLNYLQRPFVSSLLVYLIIFLLIYSNKNRKISNFGTRMSKA